VVYGSDDTAVVAVVIVVEVVVVACISPGHGGIMK
jgi:hypothetical protein